MPSGGKRDGSGMPAGTKIKPEHEKKQTLTVRLPGFKLKQFKSLPGKQSDNIESAVDLLLSKKKVIFFKSDEKFVDPKLSQFPFPENEIDFSSVFIGDSLEQIKANRKRTVDLLRSVAIVNGYVRDEPVYLCGAVPLGFVFLLCRWIQVEFTGCFITPGFTWMQFTRDKNAPSGEKKYEIWI